MPLQAASHSNLTRQPGPRAGAFGEIQHRFLHGRWVTDDRTPGRVNMDVAGHAGAIATALRLNPGDGCAERRFHHRNALADLDSHARPVGLNEHDGRQSRISWRVGDRRAYWVCRGGKSAGGTGFHEDRRARGADGRGS